MPTFTAPDGTELAFHPRGEGPAPVVLPGGPRSGFEEAFPSCEEWPAGKTDFDPAFAPFPSGEAPVPSSPGRTGPGVCGRSGQRWVLGRCS